MFSVFSDFIGQFHETSRLRLFLPTGNEEEKKILTVTILLLFHDIEFLILFFPLGMIRERN